MGGNKCATDRGSSCDVAVAEDSGCEEIAAAGSLSCGGDFVLLRGLELSGCFAAFDFFNDGVFSKGDFFEGAFCRWAEDGSAAGSLASRFDVFFGGPFAERAFPVGVFLDDDFPDGDFPDGVLLELAFFEGDFFLDFC